MTFILADEENKDAEQPKIKEELKWFHAGTRKWFVGDLMEHYQSGKSTQEIASALGFRHSLS